jgi:hypothetical protein
MYDPSPIPPELPTTEEYSEAGIVALRSALVAYFGSLCTVGLITVVGKEVIHSRTPVYLVLLGMFLVPTCFAILARNRSHRSSGLPTRCHDCGWSGLMVYWPNTCCTQRCLRCGEFVLQEPYPKEPSRELLTAEEIDAIYRGHERRTNRKLIRAFCWCMTPGIPIIVLTLIIPNTVFAMFQRYLPPGEPLDVLGGVLGMIAFLAFLGSVVICLPTLRSGLRSYDDPRLRCPYCEGSFMWPIGAITILKKHQLCVHCGRHIGPHEWEHPE